MGLFILVLLVYEVPLKAVRSAANSGMMFLTSFDRRFEEKFQPKSTGGRVALSGYCEGHIETTM